jgi:hypothetical protein
MTNQSKPFILPERNPLTHARHRKEVFWQITFPLIIGALLVVGVVVALLVMTVNEANLEKAMPLPENTSMLGDITADDVAILRYQNGRTARLSNVSQMWLLLPALLFTLLTLVVLIGLVYLFTKLLGVLPGYMRIVQDYVSLASLRIRHVLDAVLEPILKVKSFIAGARQAKQAFKQQTSELLDMIVGEGTE